MSTGLVISAILSMYYFNLLKKEIFLAALVTSPIYIFTSYTGSRFYNLSGNKYFRNISLLVLGLIGILTLTETLFNS